MNNTLSKLRDYQIAAFERYKDSAVACIGFRMGLGKSAVAIAIAEYKYRKGDIDALLIIAPNDVHRQWATEQIPKWWPSDLPRQVQCFGGRGGLKNAYPFKPGSIQIICVNIDTFSTPAKWKPVCEWANAMRTMIILDEATTIKNPKANRTERMLYEFNHIKKRGRAIIASVPISVARCVLTGTPVTNGSADIWSIMEFASPNFFNRNYYSFKDRYSMYAVMEDQNQPGRRYPVLLDAKLRNNIKKCVDYAQVRDALQITADTFDYVHSQDKYEGPYKHSEELKEKLDTVWSYKDWSDPDLAGSIPEPVYIKRTIIMSDEQKRIYDSMRKEYIAEYDGKIMTASNKLTVLLRLQQISSGFIYEKPNDVIVEVKSGLPAMYEVDEHDIEPSIDVKWIGGSNPKLDALYLDVEGSSKPCIVVTRFSCEAYRIYNELQDKGYNCCLMTGWKRVGTIDGFKNGEYDVMVANIKVISKGFNLQNSNTMLYYSNTFSLEDRLQSEGRIYRIGQTKPCLYTDYINKGTVDEKVVNTLATRKRFLDYITSANTIRDIVGE